MTAPRKRTPHPIMTELARLRQAKGWSQAALAARLHLVPSTIGNREAGLVAYGLHEVDRQARALGYQLALIPLQPNNERNPHE